MIVGLVCKFVFDLYLYLHFLYLYLHFWDCVQLYTTETLRSICNNCHHCRVLSSHLFVCICIRLLCVRQSHLKCSLSGSCAATMLNWIFMTGHIDTFSWMQRRSICNNSARQACTLSSHHCNLDFWGKKRDGDTRLLLPHLCVCVCAICILAFWLSAIRVKCTNNQGVACSKNQGVKCSNHQVISKGLIGRRVTRCTPA